MNEQDLIQFLILRNESLAEELGRLVGFCESEGIAPEWLKARFYKEVEEDEVDESSATNFLHEAIQRCSESLNSNIQDIVKGLFGDVN